MLPLRLLVITNLYPPQELGGYGRSIADFVWGLSQRGHQIEVLSSDAPYLGPGDRTGLAGEAVHRELQLKGTYAGGVQRLADPAACAAIDAANRQVILAHASRQSWDGVLLGNLDLLGPELLPTLLRLKVPMQHHVGFVAPPYPAERVPASALYQPVPASAAVRAALLNAGWPVREAPVVYPGARCELFGPEATGLPAPLGADGSSARPLKVCFAGLLMASKGAHTLVEALISLHRQGLAVQATLAGAAFQQGYREQLEALVGAAGLEGAVRWVGQLQRPALARLYALHHVGVFPSIHPEAFGIVGAEMMASGLALVTSGIGGAAELVEPGVTGLVFEPGQAASLAQALRRLLVEPGLREQLAAEGCRRVRREFSVFRAAQQLEQGFASHQAVF